MGPNQQALGDDRMKKILIVGMMATILGCGGTGGTGLNVNGGTCNTGNQADSCTGAMRCSSAGKCINPAIKLGGACTQADGCAVQISVFGATTTRILPDCHNGTCQIASKSGDACDATRYCDEGTALCLSKICTLCSRPGQGPDASDAKSCCMGTYLGEGTNEKGKTVPTCLARPKAGATCTPPGEGVEDMCAKGLSCKEATDGDNGFTCQKVPLQGDECQKDGTACVSGTTCLVAEGQTSGFCVAN